MTRQAVATLLGLLLALLPSSPLGAAEEHPIQFVDVTRQVGITWVHDNAASAEKYLTETMGGGGAFLDYNNDGRLDIYLVQSGPTPLYRPSRPLRNALYRQNPDGTFTDVTMQAGVPGNGFGMGVAVGDYDNDGCPDLYVTNFGPNILYHNNCDGTFSDVTAKAGVGAGGWSSSAAWFDYDNDGFLDLFVVRYLDWNYDKNIFCGEARPGYRSYCHPDVFHGIHSLLYRNNGDGTFTDVSEKAGIAQLDGKGLGVVAFDLNNDGWMDLFVTNDTVRNFLFKNNGNGTFSEIGLTAEVAYGFAGKPQSGMGTDAGDADGDGLPDLFVTNIDYEPNNLYHNNGDETFNDVTIQANLGDVALLFSGFGTRFFDYDDDGDMDIIVNNGHPLDNIHLFREGVAYAERPFLLENQGGRFQEVGRLHGAALQKDYAGRGLALGDFDNDGDWDLLLINNGQSPVLLRNDGGNGNHWIGFRLVGKKSNRDAVGAKLTLVAGGHRRILQKVGGGSYLSAHDPRLLVGLGQATQVDLVEVRWPSGLVERFDGLAISRYHTLEEGSGTAPSATTLTPGRSDP